MKKANFRDMSSEQFKEYRPSTEEEREDYEKESDLRDWCAENGENPQSDDVRDTYHAIQSETGQAFWDNMAPEERAG